MYAILFKDKTNGRSEERNPSNLTGDKGEKTMSEKQKYYITTAIAYTSGKPHIGNTYEIVLADAIARYKEKSGI